MCLWPIALHQYYKTLTSKHQQVKVLQINWQVPEMLKKIMVKKAKYLNEKYFGLMPLYIYIYIYIYNIYIYLYIFRSLYIYYIYVYIYIDSQLYTYYSSETKLNG